MSITIKNNTTSLQELLGRVSALQGAGGNSGENLDNELNAQATLLEEQSAKIAELTNILAGKASGGNTGTNVETCIGTIEPWGSLLYGTNVQIFYLDKNLNFQLIIINDSNEDLPCSFEVVKNSIIFCEYGFETQDGNISKCDNTVYNYIHAGIVLNDFTIYISG